MVKKEEHYVSLAAALTKSWKNTSMKKLKRLSPVYFGTLRAYIIRDDVIHFYPITLILISLLLVLWRFEERFGRLPDPNVPLDVKELQSLRDEVLTSMDVTTSILSDDFLRLYRFDLRSQ